MRWTSTLIVAFLLIAPAAASGQEADAIARARMQPGPPHESLRQLVGDWTAKSALKLGDAPAEESEATAKISMILNGRFMSEEYKGVMMGHSVYQLQVVGLQQRIQQVRRRVDVYDGYQHDDAERYQ